MTGGQNLENSRAFPMETFLYFSVFKRETHDHEFPDKFSLDKFCLLTKVCREEIANFCFFEFFDLEPGRPAFAEFNKT